MDRRHALGLGGAVLVTNLVTGAAWAEGSPGAEAVGVPDLKPSLESFKLWPKGAPGAKGVTVREHWVLRKAGGDPNDTAAVNVTDPILMVRRPKTPNGAAILMIPGGGYVRVAVSRAGGGIDQALADQGFTVFVMTYRLPADGWAAGAEAPLQDAQRAMRLIRHRAKDFGIDPARVGVIGFSAGGHLAGWVAESFGRNTYEAVDAADAHGTRPMVAGLFYPVMTMMAPYAHGVSVRQLLGPNPSEAQRRAASLELNLPAGMPPTFLAHAGDDKVVPAENSLMLYQALRAQKVPTELHIFEKGGHGLMVDGKEAPFMPLWLEFARRHGLLG